MAETKAQLGLLKVSNQREEKGKATQQLSAHNPGVQQSSWATRKPETLSEALSRMAEKGKESLSPVNYGKIWRVYVFSNN